MRNMTNGLTKFKIGVWVYGFYLKSVHADAVIEFKIRN